MTSPTLVLDLDGTLIDTAADLVGALNAVLAHEGVPAMAFSEAVAMVGHGARAMLATAIAADGGDASPTRLDRLTAQFLEYYLEHIAIESRPFPGAVEALDAFEAAGWLLAVCTNKFEAPARRLLEVLSLSHRFAFISGQDTFGVRKPDPMHLKETIRLAGGAHPAAVMVGDSDVDVAAARAAGLPVVVVEFGYSQVPVGDLGADRVIGHFGELFDAAVPLLADR